MTKQRYFFLILILGSLTALGPFSIDMYLPSFTVIAADLHTTVERVTLSLSSYFVGLAAGQLLYGPLLDKYGRKKPLYVGLAIYLVASAGCIFAASINALIALRLIQAIGSCAAAVAAMAMVRDLFPVEDNARVFALLMLVLGASPLLAPTIGGYVTAAFGWHAVFIILGIIALFILLAVIFFLPDSYEPDTTLSLKPLPILTGFWTVLKEPQFFTYVFAGALAFSGLFVYVAGAPLVFMGIYHLDQKVFGWIFAGLSIGFIGASQVNSLLLNKYTSSQIVPVALVVQLLAGLVFVVVALNGWMGLTGVLVMLFIILCCVGLIGPNTSALSLAPFTRNAGTASALMGALQLGIGSIMTMAVGLFHASTAVPLAAIMAVTSALATLIYFIGRKFIKEPVAAGDGAIVMH